MKLGWKMLIRACTIFLYVAFFCGTYLGLHVYLASTPSIQDQRTYNEENMPEYFPVLVLNPAQDGSRTLALRSLTRGEYSGRPAATEQSWHFYQPHEEEQQLQTEGVRYTTRVLSPERLEVEISISEANDQRTSIYTYEIEEHRAYPISYMLLSSFGQNFSPIPFMIILTGIFIYLSEKFYIRRLLAPSS